MFVEVNPPKLKDSSIPAFVLTSLTQDVEERVRESNVITSAGFANSTIRSRGGASGNKLKMTLGLPVYVLQFSSLLDLD